MPGSLVATGCSPSRMKAMVEDVSEATKPLSAPTGLEWVSEALDCSMHWERIRKWLR